MRILTTVNSREFFLQDFLFQTVQFELKHIADTMERVLLRRFMLRWDLLDDAYDFWDPAVHRSKHRGRMLHFFEDPGDLVSLIECKFSILVGLRAGIRGRRDSSWGG